MDARELDSGGPMSVAASSGSGGRGARLAGWLPGGSRRRSEMPVRSLPVGAPSLEVVRITSGVAEEETGCKLEQRQDFHTLFWARSGTGRQVIDGVPLEVGPPMVTVVGRGQVYRFEDMSVIDGAVISFSDDLLYEGSVTRVNPVWLVGRYGAQSVRVPAEDVARLDRLVDVLAAEVWRPPDAQSVEVHRHLLLTLLLWVQRYYDAGAGGPRNDDGDTRLHRRFVALLERDFAYRHDVDHYADALSVPAPVLARALSASTGRSTKALIMDRVMIEASRLLRFADLGVGEIASRVGLRNQFYFSRAFKQRYGESPQTYRARVRDGASSSGDGQPS